MKPIKLKIKKPAKVAPGKSKLGGAPDLPKGVAYPVNEDDEDMPFLCQINLSEFKNEIAPKGMLYFFCQLDDTTEWGQVIFAKDDKSLQAKSPKNINNEYMDIEYPLPEHPITFETMKGADRDDDDYFEIMGVSRIGGDILASEADTSDMDEISLLQINTEEVEVLEENVEEFLHFLIDKSDLAKKKFDKVLVTSQH